MNVYEPLTAQVENWKKLGNVVLISPEMITVPVCQELLGRLDSKKLLNRVVIDSLSRVQHRDLDRSVASLVGETFERFQGSRCIIYCLTIVHLKKLYAHLCAVPELLLNCQFFKYHGELSPEASTLALASWNATPQPNSLTVMIATEAFGCGIDVPDVRHVIIAGGSRSILDLWQQGGRAGRDGKRALVTVLFDPASTQQKENLYGLAYFVREKSGDFTEWAVKSTHSCRRVGIESCLGGRGRLHSSVCVITSKENKEDALCDYCASEISACAEVFEKSMQGSLTTEPIECMDSTSITPIPLPEIFDPEKAAREKE